MAKRTKPSDRDLHRALVIGVGDYPAPIRKLPAVNADVREMAKLLSSAKGAFPKQGLTVLRDRQATREAVADAVRDAFTAATDGMTVFVYLAGHGDVESGEYYFVAHDTDVDDLPQTGVPLRDIKRWFDRSPANRVFLLLDFCHSGGILGRAARAGSEPKAVLERTLRAVGTGKAILAACTQTQTAKESADVGHGFFTAALLRGLQGDAAGGDGEVTVNTLADYVSKQLQGTGQKPVYFTHMTGHVVLMHHPERAVGRGAGAGDDSRPAPPSRPAGTWVMLGENFFSARLVRTNPDGTITLEVTPADGAEEASLAGLQSSSRAGGGRVSYAAGNDAHDVRIQTVQKETTAAGQVWVLTLKPDDSGFGGGWMESSYSTGGKSYSADELARMRAGRILLNDPPPRARDTRSYGTDDFLETAISGTGGFKVTACPIRLVYTAYRTDPNWRQLARLSAVYMLKASGTVENVIELTIGPPKGKAAVVTFRGRRQQRNANQPAPEIAFTGTCPLE